MTGHYIIALILALFVLGGTTQPCLAAHDNTHAIFATADGRLLREGPAGQLIPQWETITNEAE
ncbi:MAG: hypothetical protein IJ985_00535 [Akkermansia sp.]|nr:hypothetical protein [Akkermansia sp.]